jgi:hypothetical protein
MAFEAAIRLLNDAIDPIHLRESKMLNDQTYIV